jgi:hypothetical protein
MNAGTPTTTAIGASATRVNKELVQQAWQRWALKKSRKKNCEKINGLVETQLTANCPRSRYLINICRFLHKLHKRYIPTTHGTR